VSTDRYSIVDYAAMAADTIRVEAYRRALATCVRPGSTVVDLGAGTGLLGFIACQLGAAKVVFIEKGPAADHIAATAAQNGAGDRVTVHRQDSRLVDVPGGADVLVSDLRGTTPLLGAHIATIADARTRLLRPGGHLVPLRDRVVADLVYASWPFDRQVGAWAHSAAPWRQQHSEDMAARTPARMRFRSSDLAGQPSVLASIDYRTIQVPHLVGSGTWTVANPGMLYGLGLWFESDLVEGVSYNSGPSGAAVYGHQYLPVQVPVPLVGGEILSAKVLMVLSGDDYSCQWKINIQAPSA